MRLEVSRHTAGVVSAQPPLDDCRILIIGAGPAGLGVANRLQEAGFHNYLLAEAASHPGGLSSSFTDSLGFTWDIGGHVLFSHYPYFDRLMDDLLGDEWLTHRREAWIWLQHRFVPYPFQQNIRYLPEPDVRDCFQGLVRTLQARPHAAPANFEEWILASFGEGIARRFMLPYNAKVWAYPARTLSFRWIGERVAEVDLNRVARNIREGRDDRDWGPNNTFRFPRQGGTGEIWRRLAARLPAGKTAYGKRLARLETCSRTAWFDDGSHEEYDLLVSTAPLDFLIRSSDLGHLAEAAAELKHSSTHVVGIGLKGSPPPHLREKCWIYFPGAECPFYRATVFSNYSPFNVPDASAFWSLMLEVSESPAKPVERETLVDSVIAGLLATRLIASPSEIVDVWTHRAEYGYPTPSLNRDRALGAIHNELEGRGIYSRGRFGGWKYEAGNQDHCLMQGVELADRLMDGTEETTFRVPSFATPPSVPDACLVVGR
jgi:protoporphyrinogen oxidase